MSKVVVNKNVTLDGVMQAPGRPDEDLRGGFEHGGWAQPYFDSVMTSVAAERIAKGCLDPPRASSPAVTTTTRLCLDRPRLRVPDPSLSERSAVNSQDWCS